MDVALTLARTVVLRPYVFLFLAGFLLLAVSAWGWRRTLVFSFLGFAVGWAACPPGGTAIEEAMRLACQQPR